MAAPAEKVGTLALILTEFPEMSLASTKIRFRQIKVKASRAISEKINAEVRVV